ncbi:TPA: host cell division inhibitor Icd-like protein [Klebsiella pneumoniae]|uniref:host cell division inhibitor Icd-like protein n=1 Tax=Klebsiella quasipneumoniae TaxID=1463165 RepID=UPI0015A74304|nr:host cell division inhibitor Icd-like protein [Klebsiella quasipneumoniae]EKZ9998770.1 host cell division inhibitor Icd-like protein [Klebsiella pneumoniae]HBU8750154.1 host cell division inhibitor Icd-like protein [Klebsiella pneumoniae]HBW4998640.1 host cell division inhibitor Icd-like protein [Klebsiella pneumoniae]HBW5335215.1 host cell division inhibitor Icd-like protein [Klebsiella pneumoniae]HBW5633239.1 host cell division inhibitor Icd-like protein [Klebsiella pneumoniae]
MINSQPKSFTWLFLATYTDPKALPVVLRTQANTEDEACSQLTGDFSLTFVAKIRTEIPIHECWIDSESGTLWQIMSDGIPPLSAFPDSFRQKRLLVNSVDTNHGKEPECVLAKSDAQGKASGYVYEDSEHIPGNSLVEVIARISREAIAPVQENKHA